MPSSTIPVARAMEIIAKENQNATGRAWRPITDTYLEGAPFAAQASAPAAQEGPSSGISIDESEPAHDAKAKDRSKGQKSEARGH